MKFNWGHGIFIGYVFFVVYILYFVFKSFSHDVDLVADDYYAQEVAFQDRIDQTSNAIKWDKDIQLEKVENGVRLSFSKEAKAEFSEGTIYFFRASDEKMDIRLPITLNQQGEFTIPYQLLNDGRYEAQLSWKGVDEEYFIKRIIFI
jgi:nitrogen fixation protein FixH